MKKNTLLFFCTLTYDNYFLMEECWRSTNIGTDQRTIWWLLYTLFKHCSCGGPVCSVSHAISIGMSMFILTFPYSRVYSTCTVSPGNFPFFLTGTKAMFRAWAIIGPNRKPLESSPTITSTSGHLALISSISTSIRSLNSFGFLRTGKRFLKGITTSKKKSEINCSLSS